MLVLCLGEGDGCLACRGASEAISCEEVATLWRAHCLTVRPVASGCRRRRCGARERIRGWYCLLSLKMRTAVKRGSGRLQELLPRVLNDRRAPLSNKVLAFNTLPTFRNLIQSRDATDNAHSRLIRWRSSVSCPATSAAFWLIETDWRSRISSAEKHSEKAILSNSKRYNEFLERSTLWPN